MMDMMRISQSQTKPIEVRPSVHGEKKGTNKTNGEKMTSEKFEFSSFEQMVFPCCKKPLPAPLDGTASVQCPCGNTYLPYIINEFNQLVDVVRGWRSVFIGKALIKPEPNQVDFVSSLVKAGDSLLVFLNE